MLPEFNRTMALPGYGILIGFEGVRGVVGGVGGKENDDSVDMVRGLCFFTFGDGEMSFKISISCGRSTRSGGDSGFCCNNSVSADLEFLFNNSLLLIRGGKEEHL